MRPPQIVGQLRQGGRVTNTDSSRTGVPVDHLQALPLAAEQRVAMNDVVPPLKDDANLLLPRQYVGFERRPLRADLAEPFPELVGRPLRDEVVTGSLPVPRVLAIQQQDQ